MIKKYITQFKEIEILRSQYVEKIYTNFGCNFAILKGKKIKKIKQETKKLYIGALTGITEDSFVTLLYIISTTLVSDY